jgi:CheY-like chemotaxis protein
MLFHWNEVEARERVARLARLGHEAVIPRFKSGADFKPIAADPPDAFVIDVSRLPSHGREVAAALRERAPRHVPIVFVDGAPEKLDRIRALLPDATYTDWKRVRGALRAALRRPVAAPVVPGPMAGYSGTPLPQKLGIKPGAVVALRGAPPAFERTLGRLPEGARVTRTARRADRTLLFVRSPAELRASHAAARRSQRPGTGDRAWPEASGVKTDLLSRSCERGWPWESWTTDLRDRRDVVRTSVREAETKR